MISCSGQRKPPRSAPSIVVMHSACAGKGLRSRRDAARAMIPMALSAGGVEACAAGSSLGGNSGLSPRRAATHWVSMRLPWRACAARAAQAEQASLRHPPPWALGRPLLRREAALRLGVDREAHRRHPLLGDTAPTWGPKGMRGQAEEGARL